MQVRLPDSSHQSITALELVRIDELIESWDCAFKDLETSDFVVGQVWGRTGANFILLDQIRDRMDCPTTVRSVRQLYAKWPQCLAKLIEDKANGSAVIQMLAHEIPASCRSIRRAAK